MTIANYTTDVSEYHSVQEITRLLVSASVSAIATEYDEKQLPSGITFKVTLDNVAFAYRLPCNWRGTLQCLKNDPKVRSGWRTEEHARRVSWRVLRDWIRAQLALIEAGAVTVDQVMLPYAITANGKTVYERMIAEGPKYLSLASGEPTR